MNFFNHGIDRARSYMNDAIGIFALGGLEPELSPLLYVLKFHPQNAAKIPIASFMFDLALSIE